MKVNVSQAVKARVETKLKEGIALAEKHYNTTFKYPRITYDVRGTTAGKANYVNWNVRFNPILLMENIDDFIARTVPHELAHLITDQVYPHAHAPGFKVFGRGAVRRKKRSVHGSEWQSVMRVLGVKDIARCHNYDVATAAVKRKNRYTYICSGCKQELTCGPKIHAALVRAPASRWHGGCKGHLLVLKGKLAPTPAPIRLKPEYIPTPTPSPVVPGETKIAQAKALYARNSHLDRSGLIKLFVGILHMTPAGASTYAYNVMKG